MLLIAINRVKLLLQLLTESSWCRAYGELMVWLHADETETRQQIQGGKVLSIIARSGYLQPRMTKTAND